MNSIFVRLLSNLEFLLTDHTRILLKRKYLSQNLLKNFEMFLHDFFWPRLLAYWINFVREPKQVKSIVLLNRINLITHLERTLKNFLK